MSGPHEPAREQVVLLDAAGNAIGVADKRDVHGSATPLHLAFSCYVFDDAGRLLLTRRASHKPTWPGAWTNSFCGHPGPGEDLSQAVRRRAREELGLEVVELSLALPAFRYTAVMDNGVRENEMCPVFTALATGPAEPDPGEVDEVVWVDWASFRDEVVGGRRMVSPWCVEQVRELAAAEVCGDGGAEQGGVPLLNGQDWSALPPAARG